MNKKLASNIEDQLDKLAESLMEHPCAQALLSAIPLASQGIVYLNARGAKAFQERVEFFIEDTQEKLDQLHELIDKDFLSSDEFAYLCYLALEKVIRAYQIEKIEFFSNIVVNAATIKNSDLEYKEQFLKIVDDLSPIHIRILKFIYERHDGKALEKPLDKKSRSKLPASVPVPLQAVQLMAPEISIARLESLCGDLVNHSLLIDASLASNGGYGPGKYFLGGFALEFLEFITFESKSQEKPELVSTN